MFNAGEDSAPPASGLRAGVWGGTGAAGAEVLRQCLSDARIEELLAFTRRPLASEPGFERVRQVHVEDFLDYESVRGALHGLDVVYWCLGVSQLTEPRADRYRVVTRDFATAAAMALREASPGACFHFLSGLGASRVGLSPVMWGRVKGEAEKALMDLGLPRLLIWRPTFIFSVAGRDRPTRGDRMAEALHFNAIPLLTNSTVNIAQAMLQTTFAPTEATTHGPWGINRLAKAYRAATAAQET